jgi:hypothetical protein
VCVEHRGPSRQLGSFFNAREGIRTMSRSMIDESKQTLHLGEEESSLVHPVFTDDPSKVKWLKVDVLDFLSTIDLRDALFLPTEQSGTPLDFVRDRGAAHGGRTSSSPMNQTD